MDESLYKNYNKNNQMIELCCFVKENSNNKNYNICEEAIKKAMGNNPDAAEPHNLLGIILSLKGEHLKAMKHFRAAIDLNPTYEPARKNLFCGAKKHKQNFKYSFGC